jgi:hypothetical protein
MSAVRNSIAVLAPIMALIMTASAAPPVAEAFTTNHLYRIVLLAAPQSAPMHKHFELQLSVYETKKPGKQVKDGQLDVTAGMSHGTHEFMHGMQSTPVVEAHDGVYTVRGMMFHMQGPWTLRVQVHEGGRSGTADLPLQCCEG